ncbi:hypothetical protein [Aquimarina litoralis]|uniref:hypothetical protein n=1 Tax=Aquimarina litoralis TaxID=584605 RepID=UPI001C5A190B|nr:hypothetical protein [Aquimarina litoralis]MBW1296436.1 hypothetical protein [Aquimarina litoralis]
MGIVKVTGNSPISVNQRTKQLQYLQDNLTDNELNKLHELSKSSVARNALVNKWQMIQSFLM